jgi:hypothetical protein
LIFIFKSPEIFGGGDRLNKVKLNDKIKNKWCKTNGVDLLRINYLKKNKINQILKKRLGLFF